MKKEDPIWAGIFDEIKREFISFTGNYMDAVKKGASIAEKEILDNIDSGNQSTYIVISTFIRAIKKGIHYAMEQMIIFGANYVAQMKEKQRKK
ncbi:hypothetical protein [Gracilibacillus xinjiangensis]|uniref:LXG domain-containing protein n=1 Tax=Gracilibacillus xinjiangensis TaxID=1193282 RepID=A0ABV8WVT7_9BACI